MPTSDKGFTVVELLISMAIVGIVLTGIYGLVVTSSRFYLAQNSIVAMQADARAAMDFMTRELRSAYLTPTISTTIAANDTITFDRVEDTGYSSGGNSATTLNDVRKTWQGSMFEPSSSSAYIVRIIAGTGSGPHAGANDQPKHCYPAHRIGGVGSRSRRDFVLCHYDE